MKALNLDFWRKTVEYILGRSQVKNRRIHTKHQDNCRNPSSSIFLSFSTNIQVLPPIKHFCSIIGLKEGICRVHWQRCAMYIAKYSVQGASAIKHVQCALQSRVCSVQFEEWKLQCIPLLLEHYSVCSAVQ